MDAQFTALLLQNLYQQMAINGLLATLQNNGTVPSSSLSPPTSATPDDNDRLSTSPSSSFTHSPGSSTPCSKRRSLCSNPIGACSKHDLLLWQYILDVLETGEAEDMVEWTDEEKGEFRFVDPVSFTAAWYKIKGKEGSPNLDNMLRGLRMYYKKGIVEKVKGKGSKYQFRFINVSALKERRRVSKLTTSPTPMLA